MEFTTLAGYFLALVIGFTLGLVGGGGSILTVPVLVYVLSIEPVLATAYSLFVVGLAALVGALGYIRRKILDYKIVALFALPSFISVYLNRKYVVPAIPEVIFQQGDFVMTKNLFIMVFFAVIMLLSAYSMIRSGIRRKSHSPTSSEGYNYPLIMITGLVEGAVTGLIGAGGGFLIVPALVLLARLPMKLAVGTSLLIIAIKSLFGFLGDVGTQPIEWPFLLLFSGLAVIGIFLGGYATRFMSGAHLKSAFGWLVLFMALFILIKELWAA